ncbi:unnamed protein product [Trichogramma brassicae]|uniref:Uncharacterized protein n=1 Tax=Trichogramma brassicae TaxID=86971 RepID=A0A6H5HUT2_9HYME|nr:unnamed protein product [Trichogramma brassicae]
MKNEKKICTRAWLQLSDRVKVRTLYAGRPRSTSCDHLSSIPPARLCIYYQPPQQWQQPQQQQWCSAAMSSLETKKKKLRAKGAVHTYLYRNWRGGERERENRTQQQRDTSRARPRLRERETSSRCSGGISTHARSEKLCYFAHINTKLFGALGVIVMLNDPRRLSPRVSTLQHFFVINKIPLCVKIFNRQTNHRCHFTDGSAHEFFWQLESEKSKFKRTSVSRGLVKKVHLQHVGVISRTSVASNRRRKKPDTFFFFRQIDMAIGALVIAHASHTRL